MLYGNNIISMQGKIKPVKAQSCQYRKTIT
jgi:hypothetical protein